MKAGANIVFVGGEGLVKNMKKTTLAVGNLKDSVSVDLLCDTIDNVLDSVGLVTIKQVLSFALDETGGTHDGKYKATWDISSGDYSIQTSAITVWCGNETILLPIFTDTDGVETKVLNFVSEWNVGSAGTIWASALIDDMSSYHVTPS